MVGEPLRVHGIASGKEITYSRQPVARSRGAACRRCRPLPTRVLRRTASAHRPRTRITLNPPNFSSATSRSRRSTSRFRRRSSTCSRNSRKSSASHTSSSPTTLRWCATSRRGSPSCILGKIVEVAPADDLYENPLHPYTITLLSAIPIPDPEIERRRSAIRVTGDLPSPANPPKCVPLPYAVPVC